MTAPAIVFLVIVGGVLFCVTLAVVITRARGRSLDVSPLLLLGTVLFVSGCGLGFLLTNFSSPTLETWWWVPLGRVVWTLGGAAVFVAGISREVFRSTRRKPRFWLGMGGIVVFGVLVCKNPLLDLALGPLELHGTPKLEVEHVRNRIRGGAAIYATLEVRGTAGKLETFDFTGWAASTAEEKLAACSAGHRARVTVLRYSERVLDVACE